VEAQIWQEQNQETVPRDIRRKQSNSRRMEKRTRPTLIGRSEMAGMPILAGMGSTIQCIMLLMLS
jgi:hypothetical protein